MAAAAMAITIASAFTRKKVVASTCTESAGRPFYPTQAILLENMSRERHHEYPQYVVMSDP